MTASRHVITKSLTVSKMSKVDDRNKVFCLKQAKISASGVRIIILIQRLNKIIIIASLAAIYASFNGKQDIIFCHFTCAINASCFKNVQICMLGNKTKVLSKRVIFCSQSEKHEKRESVVIAVKCRCVSGVSPQ